MSQQPAALIVGRYRLDTVVGSGSSAQVWSAWDVVLSRTVAIKLLGPQSDEEKSRIWREARLAALLGDSVAVPIYDFGDDGEHCFLVMELVSDPSLREFLTETPKPAASVALTLGLHLFDALAQTHALSIVHRDVKPENIFVGGSAERIDRVRLVDFGLAFLGDGKNASLGRLTDDRVLSGTPMYLSPEQAMGADIHIETDVYSAGCVLYEVACGVPPFEGTLGELLSKHMYVPAISLRERRPELPLEFTELVDVMLAKKPKSRPTASEAHERLARLVQANPTATASFADRSLQSSRRDRMVEAGPVVTKAKAERLLSVISSSPLPQWLSEKLADSGVQLASDDLAPDFELISLKEVNVSAPDSALPRIAWTENAAEISVAGLIESGIEFAISANTQPKRLLRSLLRLAKRPAKLEGNNS
jgi:serine/threonine protein kinase